MSLLLYLILLNYFPIITIQDDEQRRKLSTLNYNNNYHDDDDDDDSNSIDSLQCLIDKDDSFCSSDDDRFLEPSKSSRYVHFKCRSLW